MNRRLINVAPAARAAVMTTSTMTVADIWPSWSTLPLTGALAAIWMVTLKRLAPRIVRLTVDW
jgi:hypothetical protein